MVQQVQVKTIGAVALAAIALVLGLWFTRDRFERGRIADRHDPTRDSIADGGQTSPATVESHRVGVGSAPTADQNCWIEVVDPNGAPVSGATIWGASGDAFAVLFRTDAVGHTPSIPPQHRDVSLFVEADGLARREFEVASETTGACVVRLEYEKWLRGRTFFKDGGIGPSGALVVAWRSRQPVTRTDFRRLAGSGWSPLLWSGKTDARGEFAISGLPDGRYTVTAAGQGILAMALQRDAVPGEGSIELPVGQVMGYRLRLTAADGGSIRTTNEFWGPNALSWEPDEPVGVQTASLRREIDLLGVGDTIQDTPRCDDRTWLYVSPKQTDRLGPLEFHCAIPGYEPVSHEFDLQPVSRGMPTDALPLQQLANCWSGIRIVPTGSGSLGPLATTGRLAPSARVIFTSPDGTRIAEVLLRDLRDEVALSSIPCGEYDVYVEGYRTSYYWPDPQRNAGKGTVRTSVGTPPPALTIDFTGAGAVELVLTDEGGMPWTLPVSITAVRRNGGKDTWSWIGPPYFVGLVPPGTLDLSIDASRPLPDVDTGQIGQLPIQVEEGQVSIVSLTLPKLRR